MAAQKYKVQPCHSTFALARQYEAHVILPDHIRIIYEVNETRLTRQKHDRNDPDCPGYPTHFQRWFRPV